MSGALRAPGNAATVSGHESRGNVAPQGGDLGSIEEGRKLVWKQGRPTPGDRRVVATKNKGGATWSAYWSDKPEPSLLNGHEPEPVDAEPEELDAS